MTIIVLLLFIKTNMGFYPETAMEFKTMRKCEKRLEILLRDGNHTGHCIKIEGEV